MSAPDSSDVNHEAYSREHALWHVWKASRYYAAFEAFAEMLKVEEKQHQTDNRTARMQVLKFSQDVLDNLIENELLEVHKELTKHLTRMGKLPRFKLDMNKLLALSDEELDELNAMLDNFFMRKRSGALS